MRTRGILVLASLGVAVTLVGCGGTEVSPADGKDDTAAVAGSPDVEAPPHPDLPSDDDVRAVIDALAAGGPELGKALRLTKPGSVAHGYVRYLMQGYQSEVDGGFPQEPAGVVTKRDEGYEICFPGTEERYCLMYQDFEGTDGKLVDFVVGNRPLGPRLVVGNGKPTNGTNGLQGTFVAAFGNSTGSDMLIGFKLRTRDAAFISGVTYRSPQGRQSTAASITGPSELGSDSMANFQAQFPGAKPGGVMTVNMYGLNTGLDYSITFDTVRRQN